LGASLASTKKRKGKQKKIIIKKANKNKQTNKQTNKQKDKQTGKKMNH